MSAHYEWVGVENTPINVVPKYFNVNKWAVVVPFEGDDLDEGSTEGPSIVIGSENGIVITAESKDQLVEFARTLLRMAENSDV